MKIEIDAKLLDEIVDAVVLWLSKKSHKLINLAPVDTPLHRRLSFKTDDDVIWAEIIYTKPSEITVKIYREGKD